MRRIATCMFVLGGLAGAACKPRPPPTGEPLTIAIAAARDVELPTVAAKVASISEATVLVVSPTRITLGGDRYPVATIPSDRALGLGADDKRDGRGDLYVTPLALALRGRIDERTSDGGTGKSLESMMAELESFGSHAPTWAALVADRRTSYRVLVEVVHTVEAVKSGPVCLVVNGTGGAGCVRVRDARSKRAPYVVGNRAPRAREPARRDGPVLDLLVILEPDGFDLWAHGVHIAPGCADVGPGRTVPDRARSADLNACASKVKAAAPEFAVEDSYALAAPESTELQEIASVVVAMASTADGKPLLPEARLVLPEKP